MSTTFCNTGPPMRRMGWFWRITFHSVWAQSQYFRSSTCWQMFIYEMTLSCWTLTTSCGSDLALRPRALTSDSQHFVGPLPTCSLVRVAPLKGIRKNGSSLGSPFIQAFTEHLFCVWHAPVSLLPWLLTSLPPSPHGQSSSRSWRANTPCPQPGQEDWEQMKTQGERQWRRRW